MSESRSPASGWPDGGLNQLILLCGAAFAISLRTRLPPEVPIGLALVASVLMVALSWRAPRGWRALGLAAFIPASAFVAFELVKTVLQRR